jgi:transposase
MAERKFRDLSKYKTNVNVEKITGSNLRFNKEFKVRAIKLYQSGESPMDIFLDAGIDLNDFEYDYARKSISRWLRALDTYGLKNINKERRGLGASGRPGGGKKFKSMEAELAYLRAENNFLKKLKALEKNYLKKKNMK